MSFVFGGKLLGQDGPVVDTSGLEKLSKNEKLLLVELERTRMNIAQELSILKQCKGGDTSALDDAILAYSEQRRKDLYATKNDPGNFYDTSRKTIRGKSNQSRTAMQARGRAGIGGTSVLSMTAPGGAPIRTALDTLPVFASMRPVKESTGRDYGKSKTLPFRMPVFALPPIALAVQQDGTIKAAAASSDVSRISFSGGTITKSESSVWPDAAPDRPGSGLNGKGMTNSEALACEIFLMFTSQNIGDVNRLLNIGMDPFARGKALKGRPELMSMTSFAAVREQVLPQPLPKSKSDIGFKTQSSSNAIRQKIERSSTIGHMQQNPSTIFGGTLGSTDDVSTFGGSTYTPGASADPFDGGKTVRSSMGPRKSKLGLIGAGKKKGGRLTPVMTVDGMPNRNCGADDLRKELMNSLASMQKYTVMVSDFTPL